MTVMRTTPPGFQPLREQNDFNMFKCLFNGSGYCLWTITPLAHLTQYLVNVA